MKDTITCPSCNVENPKNRLTCQVCHDPLTPKTEKVKGKTKKGDEVGSKVDPKTPPPQRSKQSPPPPPSSPFSEQLFKDKLPTSGKKEIPKVPIKRRARRKSRMPIESQYFILQNGTLIPVQIIQTVRTLKKKAISVQAQALMSLWNRNKGLLVK